MNARFPSGEGFAELAECAMASVSTHVLDAAAGGARSGVMVSLADSHGQQVAAAVTGDDGRAEVATGLEAGVYRLSWRLGGEGVLIEVSVSVVLEANRPYHLPLLASSVSAVAYLGV